jgi:hypothetical protein
MAGDSNMDSAKAATACCGKIGTQGLLKAHIWRSEMILVAGANNGTNLRSSDCEICQFVYLYIVRFHCAEMNAMGYYECIECIFKR